MSTVAVSLSTGERIQVQGEYESIKSYLAPRTMMQDTGEREITTAEGLKETIKIGAVIRIAELSQALGGYKAALGFQA